MVGNGTGSGCPRATWDHGEDTERGPGCLGLLCLRSGSGGEPVPGP